MAKVGEPVKIEDLIIRTFGATYSAICALAEKLTGEKLIAPSYDSDGFQNWVEPYDVKWRRGDIERLGNQNIKNDDEWFKQVMGDDCIIEEAFSNAKKSDNEKTKDPINDALTACIKMTKAIESALEQLNARVSNLEFKKSNKEFDDNAPAEVKRSTDLFSGF